MIDVKENCEITAFSTLPETFIFSNKETLPKHHRAIMNFRQL